MTDATPEQLALARKIATDLWPGNDTEYLFERRAAQEAALAAIIETTERAAKLAERGLYSTVKVAEVDSPVRWNRRSIGQALRNGEHLK